MELAEQSSARRRGSPGARWIGRHFRLSCKAAANKQRRRGALATASAGASIAMVRLQCRRRRLTLTSALGVRPGVIRPA